MSLRFVVCVSLTWFSLRLLSAVLLSVVENCSSSISASAETRKSLIILTFSQRARFDLQVTTTTNEPNRIPLQTMLLQLAIKTTVTLLLVFWSWSRTSDLLPITGKGLKLQPRSYCFSLILVPVKVPWSWIGSQLYQPVTWITTPRPWHLSQWHNVSADFVT